MLSQSIDYLRQMQITGADLSLDVLRGTIVFLAFFLVALVIRKAIRAAIGRMSTQGHVDHIIAQLAYAATLTIGAVVALSATGRVNVATLVASLGLAGFAVGFAVKDVLSNFLAGVLILVQRPFTVGDEIALSGVEGRVESIRVRDTLIKTAEGSLLYIPNNIVFNSIVANKTAFSVRLVAGRFKCDYQADIGKLLETCSRLMSEIPGVLKAPAPQVFLAALAEDGLEFQLKFWIDPRESSTDSARSSVLRAINEELRSRNIRFLNTSEAFDEKSS